PLMARKPSSDDTNIHLPKPRISWNAERSQSHRLGTPGNATWLSTVVAIIAHKLPATSAQIERSMTRAQVSVHITPRICATIAFRVTRPSIRLRLASNDFVD